MLNKKQDTLPAILKNKPTRFTKAVLEGAVKTYCQSKGLNSA